MARPAQFLRHCTPVHHVTTFLHPLIQLFRETATSVIHSYRRRLAVRALSSVCGRPGRHVAVSDSSAPTISFTSVAPSQCSCSSRTVLRFVVGPSSIEDSRTLYIAVTLLSSFSSSRQEPRLLFLVLQSLGGWVSHIVYAVCGQVYLRDFASRSKTLTATLSLYLALH
jgi:hypothetical protein